MEIKHHHIKFKESPGKGNPIGWESEIKKIKGIKRVTIDMEKGDLIAEYDLLECREEAIERGMLEAGFILDVSFREKLKRGWIHFTEENEQAELKSGAAPCCDLEELERRRAMTQKKKTP
ncbi:MAG: hypothetical protein HZA09_03030 [Nitrospirae bacterium]|nr:hypothetical protein [Nitrospirota bacterium]